MFHTQLLEGVSIFEGDLLLLLLLLLLPMYSFWRKRRQRGRR